MAQVTAENNKRIAKNTLLLYVRMFFTMSISLYTSRVILRILGVEDYGIYNVIAGMVLMFSFLNTTLASGTQRFITYAIGTRNLDKCKITFSTTFIIHLSLSLIIAVIILLAGAYFLNGKLVIPSNRLDAAYWVFYSSIIAIVLNITQVPYMSSIIAHEKMGVYAYMSIFDAFAKLAICYALVISDFDRLKMYSCLYSMIALINLLVYKFYCSRNFEECHIKYNFDKKLFREIASYSGWNIFGCTSVLLNNQGLNMVLNVFFGPVVNAARGISNQVNNVAIQFVNSFQTAVNPQIVKYYASGETDHMNNLIYNNARFSGLLVLMIILPLSVELPFVLDIWLEKYPNETVFITRIILLQTLITSFDKSVIMGIAATGKMKKVNLCSIFTLMLIVPIACILFKCGANLETVMILTPLPWVAQTFVVVYTAREYYSLSPFKFFANTYGCSFPIGFIMLIPLVLIHLNFEQGWSRFIISLIVSITWGGLLFYQLGLKKHMRDKVKFLIKNKFLTYIRF